MVWAQGRAAVAVGGVREGEGGEPVFDGGPPSVLRFSGLFVSDLIINQ